MDDHQIMDLYWARDQKAIAATAEKYGRYCQTIACRILGSREDGEECVNDAYLRAWNAIPPQRPDSLAAFLGAVTRNLALDRYRNAAAEKRGAGQTALVLEELEGCCPTPGRPGRLDDDLALTDALNRFLASLPPQTRIIFLRRYWYFSTIKEIAAAYRMCEGKVKMILLRTRRKLKTCLEKEEILCEGTSHR